MKSLDVIAIGSCYVDINVPDYPIGQNGLANETETIGGSYETVPGGSAVNFCRLLGSLGIRSGFIGVTGTDSMGDLLDTMLKHDGVEPLLLRKPEVQTNIGYNMTSTEGAHIMCVAGTANATLSSEDVLPVLSEASKKSDAIYLGGCFKLKSLSGSFNLIVEMAKINSSLLYIDHGRIPAAATPDILDNVRELVLQSDYYLASRKEFTQLWDVSDIDEGLLLLNDRAPQLMVVVKDGENGAFYTQNGESRHVSAVEVASIINLTGAGDSFNAGFMTAISAEKSMEEAVTYGCSVAASKISGQPTPRI